jgi:hypothetical protein
MSIARSSLCTKSSNNNNGGFSGFFESGGWGDFPEILAEEGPISWHAHARRGAVVGVRTGGFFASKIIEIERAAFSQRHKWIRNAAMKIASASYASNPKESGKH